MVGEVKNLSVELTKAPPSEVSAYSALYAVASAPPTAAPISMNVTYPLPDGTGRMFVYEYWPVERVFGRSSAHLARPNRLDLSTNLPDGHVDHVTPDVLRGWANGTKLPQFPVAAK